MFSSPKEVFRVIVPEVHIAPNFLHETQGRLSLVAPWLKMLPGPSLALIRGRFAFVVDGHHVKGLFELLSENEQRERAHCVAVATIECDGACDALACNGQGRERR